MTVPLSDTRLTSAEVRLAQYREQSTWSNATYGSGAEKALHEIATGLKEEIDRLRAELTAEPAQPSPEHQAIYLDDFDQVWCDYPTVAAGDDVLPLVWASEQAQSRADLADGGNRLRVIGWCR